MYLYTEYHDQGREFILSSLHYLVRGDHLDLLRGYLYLVRGTPFGSFEGVYVSGKGKTIWIFWGGIRVDRQPEFSILRTVFHLHLLQCQVILSYGFYALEFVFDFAYIFLQAETIFFYRLIQVIGQIIHFWYLRLKMSKFVYRISYLWL